MLDIIMAGGWLMLPIIACSVISLAIVIERFWTLNPRRVLPRKLVNQIWQLQQKGQLSSQWVQKMRASSPLGRVLASGLMNANAPRVVMKESIEETGRHVAQGLERYLNTLGTIAAITPLLGLLGTVIGMIKVFSVITAVGVGDPGELAGGISQALVTTAAGISVAIPTLIFHRYFRGRVNRLVVGMEEEAIRLMEVIHGERATGGAR
ncbi:MAG: MotA/TolQ/ExbB proton channel family protein [Gammaproteobacteria bacterium]|nr:MotA/TolQ/ExbB proton channel family protein [Gammaproteobacteria bacterium]